MLLLAVLPKVLPAGAGGVDHFIWPAVLFPLLWAGFAVLPVAVENLRPVAISYGAAFAVGFALAVSAFI